MATTKTKNGNFNDALGKAHELLMAYNLSGNSWPSIAHFRDEGSTPKEVFDIAANTIGHDTYVVVADNTWAMKQTLMEELFSRGAVCNTTDVRAAAWTSNRDTVNKAGDHELFTGHKDLNSEADVIIVNHSGDYIGVSLKYGTTKNPNLANPGIANIEQMMGLTGLTEHTSRHRQFLIDLGYNSSTYQKDHEIWKSEKDTPRGKAANESSLQCKKIIARDIRNHLNAMGSEYIRKFVVDMCGRPTVHPHYRTHTRPTRSGLELKVDDARRLAEVKAASYEGFHVNTDQDSTRVTIYATLKGRGDIDPVASLSIKSQSGPIKNCNGIFTAPMLTEKKRKIKRKYVFDLDDTIFWYNLEDSPLVWLMSSTGMVRKLTPAEYSSFVLGDDQFFEFSEFENTARFSRAARPIQKIIDKIIGLVGKGEDVNILTARHGVDDMEMFLATLRRFGIDTDRVVVHLAGAIKLPDESTASSKRRLMVGLIDGEHLDEVHFWDDNRDNLREFLSIRETHPNLRAHAYLVRYNPARDTCPVKKVTLENVMEA